MAHPAVYVATGVVIAVAAILAFLTSRKEREREHSYSQKPPSRSPSPPPSPPPSSVRQRRPPPSRNACTSTENSSSTSANSQRSTCTNCCNSPYVKVLPCNHESLCKGCFNEYLETNDTCKDCNGRIDSVFPAIPPYGKCTSCKKFKRLLKFLPCDHSLSICISCFESQNTSHKKCPECREPIQDYEPKYNTSGLCRVCNAFVHFAMFQPCGHGHFCMEHARMYLGSQQECNVCGRRVTEVV